MTLEDQKREAEAALKEAQVPGRARELDQGALKQEINHIDKALHDGRAPRLSGNKKDSLAKEAKNLAEQIKEGMPTREEMSHPSRHPGAIAKHLNWDKRNAEKIQRYKEIQRQINPEAPINIESLRRAK
jgi:hypothetical protein